VAVPRIHPLRTFLNGIVNIPSFNLFRFLPMYRMRLASGPALRLYSIDKQRDRSLPRTAFPLSTA
jgi:hypothetical protein